MSKVELVEVNTPLNSSSFQHQINQNFVAISNALDNQLQRTEQEDVDNFMARDLDMNSHTITNLAAPVNPSDAARKQDVLDGIAQSKEYAERAETAAGLAEGYASDALASKRTAASAAQTAVDAKDIAVDAKDKAIAAKETAEEEAQTASDAADLAQDWATKTDGTVDGNEYSAKYYAEQAESIVADLAISNASDVQLNNLTNGEVLIWDSTDQKWENGKIDSLPDQEGNSGKFLTTNGVTASWGKIGTTLADIAEAGTGIAFSNPIGPSENFTVVGNPTIVDGVASNFYYDRYIYVDETFDVTGKSWELEGSFVSTYDAGEDHYCCGRYNPFTPFIVGTNSSGQPIATIESNQLTNSSDPITLNTKHLFVLSFDKDTSTYTFNTKEESAGSWVTTTLQGDPITTIKPFCIGNALGFNPWVGSLDLTDYKLTIDNAVAWESYTIRPAEKTTISSTVVGLPSQTGHSGEYLTTNGSEASWGTVETLPSQAGNAGKFLATNGSEASWEKPLPDQTGNAKKLLTTNGVNASWMTKDYLRSLTPEQRATLIATGSYNGEVVTDDEVFTDTTGKFVLDTVTEVENATNGYDISGTAPSNGGATKLGYFDNGENIKYVLLSNFGGGTARMWYSSDKGATFTQATVNANLPSWGETPWNFYSTSKAVLYTYNISGGCAITTNGTVWNNNTITLPETPTTIYIRVFKDKFYIFDAAGWYIYSENGTSWSEKKTFPTVTSISNIVSNLDAIHIFADNKVYKTTDGDNWNGGASSNYYGTIIACGHKVFCNAVSKYGQSSDGTSFTETSGRLFGADNNRNSYFYVDGTYFVGYETNYKTSIDGATWGETHQTIYVYEGSTIWVSCWGDRGQYSTDSGPRIATGDTFLSGFAQYPTSASPKIFVINVGTSYTSTLTDLSLTKSEVETAVGGVLPSQTGQSGKFLTTDGTNASWATVGGGGSIELSDIADAGTGITFEGGTTTTQNFTVVGSPTITDGVASGFSSSNYIDTGITFNPQGDSWAFRFKYNTGTDVYNIQQFIGIDNSKFIQIDLNAGRFELAVSFTGNDWNILLNSGAADVDNYEEYYLEVGWDGTKYYIKRSSTGWDTLTTYAEQSSTTPISADFTSKTIKISNYMESTSPQDGWYLRGELDLNECAYYVDGVVVWTPYTTVTTDKTAITLDIATDQASAPTSADEGYVGQLWITSGGAVYICTGVSGSTYTWVQVSVS